MAQVTASDNFDPDSTPGDDSTTDDDDDTVALTPNPVADLRLEKSVNDGAPDVGTNVVFTIVVTNDGPSDATGVTVTDLLPSGYSYVDSTVTQGSYDPVTGIWDVGELAGGASATLTSGFLSA